MKNKKLNCRYLVITILILLFNLVQFSFAQDSRWLHVSNLQSPINEIGAEYEGEFTGLLNTNYFSWPAQYGLEQNTMRMQGLWIGCKNFDDPVENKIKSVKVIGSGPRKFDDVVNQIFEKEIKLYGKFDHPIVYVDDQPATPNDDYDEVDEIDENMAADRMVVVKFNTSMGISVTKKVMAFTSPNHQDYYINDYVFKNTGIYNRNGDIKQQTLNDVYFYWLYRFAFAGESVDGSASTWGAFGSSWGNSTVNHSFGEDVSALEFTDPNSPTYQMRGFYSWYSPNKDRSVSYAEDWGCPNEDEDGRMGSWKYGGCVTLHSDKSNIDFSDDLLQPKTTWYIGSDINIMLGTVSQYNELFMNDRYTAMSEGHPSPEQHHDVILGDTYPNDYADPRRNTGGGTSQGQGYGPYTIPFGDSIHIVFASGISGLYREKNLEVGKNWYLWYTNQANPVLVLPDGSTTTDHNLYKRRWVQTGKDSIIKIFRNAINNYNSGYTLPAPPPPPEQFTVTSGGDRIKLEWSENAVSSPHFNGYVIYRAKGNVLDPDAKYEKIFECDNSTLVHRYDDTTAIRGFDYYYYVQSKDDGTQNDVEPGVPLYSSLFYTVTNLPATLQRPAGTLETVKVVPNPYDIRARLFQFGDQAQYDRIAFYGIPGICKLKIFTERGDLIWEMDHTRGTGDELWNSTTSSGQIVASGIYILYVETPDGESTFKKFVIIR